MHVVSTHLWIRELDLARLGDNRHNLRLRREIDEGSGKAIEAF